MCENRPILGQNYTQYSTYAEVMLPFISPCHILYKTENNTKIYKPLYILTFNFEITSLSQNAIEFLKTNPDTLKHTAEKIRWYRYKNRLLQKDVADKIGIDRTTYINYESTDHDFYMVDKLYQLASLFKIDITKLLDDYNLFLYNGQGKQIKFLRKTMGLSVPEFAKLYNTTPQSVRKWEKDEVIIFKSTWKRIFESQ